MLRSENEIVFPFEKNIIFTVVPFVDCLSHLGRRQYNAAYNCVQSLCLIAIKYA